MPLSLSRMCCSPEEAKVVLPQSPAKSKIAQGGGEMAAGTSAKGMDWMDLNVQLGLVATGRGRARNGSSKDTSPQVTRNSSSKDISSRMTSGLGTMYSKATGTGAISHLQGASTQSRNRLSARASLLAAGLATTAAGRKVIVTSWWHQQPCSSSNTKRSSSSLHRLH